MEKVIYYCKACRSTFGTYPNSGRIKCLDCGSDLVNTNYPVESWRKLSDEEKELKRKEFDEIVDNSYRGETNYNGESSIGNKIKFLSYIFMILSIIGSIVIMVGDFVVGLIVLMVCLLDCFLCIAIGEICNLLNSINNKLN